MVCKASLLDWPGGFIFLLNTYLSIYLYIYI